MAYECESGSCTKIGVYMNESAVLYCHEHFRGETKHHVYSRCEVCSDGYALYGQNDEFFSLASRCFVHKEDSDEIIVLKKCDFGECLNTATNVEIVHGDDLFPPFPRTLSFCKMHRAKDTDGSVSMSFQEYKKRRGWCLIANNCRSKAHYPENVPKACVLHAFGRIAQDSLRSTDAQNDFPVIIYVILLMFVAYCLMGALIRFSCM